MTSRREAHDLAQVSADVCLPGKVGTFVSMIDVQDRVGQGLLLRVPVIVMKAVAWEEISVPFNQESPQFPLWPVSDIRADIQIRPSDRSTEAA